MSDDRRLGWSRAGVDVATGRLRVAGRDAAELAAVHGTPLWAFDLGTVGEQVTALRSALDGAGLPDARLRLAVKAMREPEVLAYVRALGDVGIDACSPGEVLLALAHGWVPEEVSLTGTNLSDRDLAVVLPHGGLRLNLDAVSQVERVGRHAPGRRIGLRLNPRAGASSRTSHGESLYSRADRPTKLGITPDRLDDATAAARRYGLELVTAHFHVGYWLLDDALPAFDRAVGQAAAMVARLQDSGCPIEEVNAGGGLGLPLDPGERPLDLDAYAAVLARHLRPLGVTVAAEPGEFLVDAAGVLLAEVVTVEVRDGVRFVGLDVGWNVANCAFVYGTRPEVVLCRAADAPRPWIATIAGNINEGDDVFREDHPVPALVEGDVVALVGTAGYNQAMASDHCLRPPAGAVYFADRLP